MNYKKINTCIIQSKEITNLLIKDKSFYGYLLNNNVAYYYSTSISKQINKYEKGIMRAGNQFNKRYIKTLKIIMEISKEAGIDFLLFKTFKHFPEAVDGDIDLFIQEKNFYQFLQLLTKRGFTCTEDARLKASCKKSNFCIIEPRVHISFLGRTILEEKHIWRNIEEVTVDKLKVKTTTKELDTFFLLLNVLYGPNYFKLYSYLIFKTIDLKKMYSLAKNDAILLDLQLVIQKLLSSYPEEKKFPLFTNDIVFLKWWSERILGNPKNTFSIKIKYILFFLYAKYRYTFFDKLPFRHDWNLTYA